MTIDDSCNTTPELSNSPSSSMDSELSGPITAATSVAELGNDATRDDRNKHHHEPNIFHCEQQQQQQPPKHVLGTQQLDQRPRGGDEVVRPPGIPWPEADRLGGSQLMSISDRQTITASPTPLPHSTTTRPPLQTRQSSFSKRHASFDTPREIPLPPGSEYPFPLLTEADEHTRPELKARPTSPTIPTTTSTSTSKVSSAAPSLPRSESNTSTSSDDSSKSTTSLPLHNETLVRSLPQLQIQNLPPPQLTQEQRDQLPSPPLFIDSDSDFDLESPKKEKSPSSIIKSSSSIKERMMVYSHPSSSYIPPPPPSPPLPVRELSPMPRKVNSPRHSPSTSPTPTPGGKTAGQMTGLVKQINVSLQQPPKSILKNTTPAPPVASTPSSTSTTTQPSRKTTDPTISRPYPLGMARPQPPPIPASALKPSASKKPPSPMITTKPPSPLPIPQPTILTPPDEKPRDEEAELKRSSSAHEKFIPPPFVLPKEPSSNVGDGDGAGAGGGKGKFIAVETREEAYEIVCRLEGCDRNGITLTTRKPRTLHLAANYFQDPNPNSKPTGTTADGDWHFERRITFGLDADLKKVRAEFDGELLRVTVPRIHIGTGMRRGGGRQSNEV